MRYRFFFILLFLFVPQVAEATCICRCVDGRMRALCDSTIEIPPICPIMICPLNPVLIPPVVSPGLPPLGAKRCWQAQVYDYNTMRHEWRQVCK